ncbi:MAG: Crp/Fnr family transcriptional regulator [Rhizobiales bacterium]|nr:Crp/Fnr family transcriptional regulator [Hyphomicrobiales bacterium]
MAEPRSRNHILSILTSADIALLNPHLQHVELPSRMVLEEPNKPIQYVFFPEGGLVSVVAAAGRHKRAEAGIIGVDGFTGHPVVMGDSRSPNSVYMQIPGRGLRISADALRAQMRASDTLRGTLHKFVASFLVQASYTVLAYSTGTLAGRMARWLLMANDRVGGDSLDITHEFLSIMLGVRRAGVTVALQDLESKGVVVMSRSKIRIVDREGLEELAKDIYGIPEAEQTRLTGWRSSPT